MTLSDIVTKIRQLTGTEENTSSYPDSQILIDINIWYQKIASMILDAQDETDWDDPNRSDYPFVTTPVTTNRDYEITSDLAFLKMKSVSVSYDGVNFYQARPIDENEIPNGFSPASSDSAQAELDRYFSKIQPKYDIKYGSLWLYPRASSDDMANGGILTMEFFRSPQEFTSDDITTGTATPGFDISFHALLAYGPAFEYSQVKNLPQTKALFTELQDYEARLRRQYSSKQTDRRYALQSDLQYYK